MPRSPISKGLAWMILGALLLIVIPSTLVFIYTKHAKSPTCPSSFQPNPSRAIQILALLSTTEEGKKLNENIEARRPTPIICFGPIPIPAVLSSSIILLNPTHSLPESASRLGHLFTHVLEGLPMSAAPGDCDARVEDALSKEARAFAVELRLRRALGMGSFNTSPPALSFEFESEFWKAPELEREVLIKNYLVAHPDGAPGVDALGASYRRRCGNDSP